ncbi:MAG: cytochrome c oxidase subunit II [Acidobacteriota bacterium]|nr:cytochrome c oxidase subunit II [Acidobacteriota bacterium]
MQISTFAPRSPQAGGIESLFVFTLIVCGVVFAIVAGLVCYSAFRYRSGRRGAEPPANFGNRTLEIIWTAIPVLILVVLFGFTWKTVQAIDPPPARDPDVIVTGRQWWWGVEYPKSGVITANEIHLPVGRDLSVRVLSGDVIHDFWVPQLARKMDAVPGLQNHVWIRVDRPGVYLGACSEYCGAEHAWMRFRVIGESPEQFDSWQGQQAQAAAVSPDPQAQTGAKRFQELTCANCHAIKGTDAKKHIGPDLTHMASRKMLAGERIQNTRENLSSWLKNPDAIKPGTNMPNLQLAKADVVSLTAYLESLK